MCIMSLQLCLTLSNPVDCSPPGSSVRGDSPGKNTGVGCHDLLQGIFPTQRSNPPLLCFLYWQVGSLPPALSGMPHSNANTSLYQEIFLIHFQPIFSFSFYFSFYFILEYSQFTMLGQFQVYSKVIQLDIYIYLFIFKFFSHSCYYRVKFPVYIVGPY